MIEVHFFLLLFADIPLNNIENFNAGHLIHNYSNSSTEIVSLFCFIKAIVKGNNT